MWPKMLLEFLPHLTRLIPAADTYLNSRKDSDNAHQVALASLDDTVHGGLTRIAEEQVALRRELQAQSVDVEHLRQAIESLDSRLAAVEHRLSSAIRLLWAAIGLIAVVLVLLAVRLFH